MANPPKLYVPVPAPVVDDERHITRDWVLLFDQLIGRLAAVATGTVLGPPLASAASRLLGRGSAGGAGEWEELTVGTGATITGTVVTAKPDDVVLRGTRAAQPAANAVLAGTLYAVTDEDNLLERSNGATWDTYTETGPAGPTGPPGPAGANGRSVNSWPYVARTGATSGDPGDSKILWNNATQTSATAILIDDLNDETPTFDVSLFLALCEAQMRLVIQDRNDATQYQRWRITGASTDLGGYWSVPVTLIDSAGGSFVNNEQIEIGLVWASPSDSNETLVLSTDTGTQTAWAPGLYGDTAVHWSGASDLTVRGIAGGSSGQCVRFKNSGATWAWFNDLSGAASPVNRLALLVSSGPLPVAPGGSLLLQHDGTNWRQVQHEQGAAITPSYSAADFTGNGSMGWGVDAGDVGTYSWVLHGVSLTVTWFLNSTDVTGTASTTLRLAVPNAFLPAATTLHMCLADNAGAGNVATFCIVTSGTGWIDIYNALGAAGWTITTSDNTRTFGSITFEVI